jgi:MATE family multidrug resistance protein
MPPAAALAAPTPRRPGRRRRGVLLAHEAERLLALAGPIILSQLGGVGMSTMDTLMVGPLGAEALATAGLASSLHMIALMVSAGCLLGMGPMVSQAHGAGDDASASRALVQGLWLALLLAAPIVVLNLLGQPLALALGQTPRIALLVGEFMRALAWGVIPILLFSAFRQYLEGMGAPRAPMVITFLGLAVNFVGNRLLIYGLPGRVPALGVVGSAWSTSIVRWAMLFVMMGYIAYRHSRAARGGSAPLPRLALEGGLLRRILAVGAPAGAQIGLEVGLFSFAAVMMGWFGAVELGTHQVALNLASTTFMVALGVSAAGSIRVGQNLGAGRPAAVRRSVMVTYLLAVGFMALCALAFLTIPEPLLRLYTHDPSILALGRRLLFMAALFQVFDGMQVSGFSVLRGAADTRVPMFLAALAYWVVGAPGAYLLAFHTALGPVGIWAGLCLGLAAAAILLLWRVRLVLGGSSKGKVQRAE